MIYIGIDPGKTGAIAVLDKDSKPLAWEVYANWKACQRFLENWNSFEVAYIIKERLHAMPIRGCMGNWSLGLNVGGWEASLASLNLSADEVLPQEWQKAMLGKVPKGETKKYAVAHANTRWPVLALPCKTKADITRSSGVADAFLIAEFGRIKRTV